MDGTVRWCGGSSGVKLFREDVHNLVRFHFAKQDDTLNEAIKRLATLKEKAINAKNVDWR